MKCTDCRFAKNWIAIGLQKSGLCKIQLPPSVTKTGRELIYQDSGCDLGKPLEYLKQNPNA